MKNTFDRVNFSLAPRKFPSQEKQEIKAYRFISVSFSEDLLRARYNDKMNGEKKEDILNATSPMDVHSFLRGDFLIVWKHPKYVPQAYAEKAELYDNYCKFAEPYLQDGGKHLAWTCLNHINLDMFRKCFKTPKDFYMCIYVPGVADPQKPATFSDSDFNDKYDNSGMRLETIRAHTQRHHNYTNHSHGGFTWVWNGDKNTWEAKHKSQQNNYAGDTLEWYIPDFDNSDYKSGLSEKPRWFGSTDWLAAYNKCVYRGYQKDNRVTLLYRRHEPAYKNGVSYEDVTKAIEKIHSKNVSSTTGNNFSAVITGIITVVELKEYPNTPLLFGILGLAEDELSVKKLAKEVVHTKIIAELSNYGLKYIKELEFINNKKKFTSCKKASDYDSTGHKYDDFDNIGRK